MTPLKEQDSSPRYEISDWVVFENRLRESIPLVDRCFLFVNRKASRDARALPEQQPTSQETGAAVLLFC
jgi:hypothetical protein